MPDRPTEKVEPFIQGALIGVTDVEATAAFYRDVLGFRFDYGDANYAVVWRENAAVHFTRSDDASSAVALFFWVEDVDGLHAELMQRGAMVVSPLTPSPTACATSPLATWRDYG
jgi:predicted enzyme related to lactoylglutathione lyase